MAANKSGLAIISTPKTSSSRGIIQKPRPIEANFRAMERLNIMLSAPSTSRPAMTYIIPWINVVGMMARITPSTMLPIPTMGKPGMSEWRMLSSEGVSISLPLISDMALSRSAMLAARRFSA